MDTFTEYALRQEVNLVLMSPIHWRAQMEKRRPVCLFVESAWWGNNGGWRNRIVGYDGAEDNPLRELLEYCRSNGIPTVFWNKEDPPHFDNFLSAAREFDFVFTSDEDCVPRYREALGHDRIYVLPFAAAPRIHNPSREKGWPNYPVCFAGSWVSHKYPERVDALRYLLDPAVPLGLHIFDRNLTRTEFGPDYRFPDRYKEAIKGTLTYEEMLTAYRCYDVMLNVNTITDSPTMFARRVFESLACGTPVISSESAGMSRMLEGHVRVTQSLEETKKHLQELLGDEEARVREGHLAYRHVHENHTYRQRIDEVFRRVGLDQIGSEQPSVSVLMPTMRPQNVARCIENFTKQTYQDKELILILNNADFDLDAIRRDAEQIPNVQVLYIDGRTTLGDCLRGVEAASGDYVARWTTMITTGSGTYRTTFLQRRGRWEGTVLHVFRRYHSPETSGHIHVLRTTLVHRTFAGRFRSIHLEDTNFGAAARAGCRVYSADRFNFIRVRTRRSINHSALLPHAEFLKRCRAERLGFGWDDMEGPACLARNLHAVRNVGVCEGHGLQPRHQETRQDPLRPPASWKNLIGVGPQVTELSLGRKPESPWVFRPRGDIPDWEFSLPLDWSVDPFKDRSWQHHLHSWRTMEYWLHEYRLDGDVAPLMAPIEIALDWHRFHVEEGRRVPFSGTTTPPASVRPDWPSFSASYFPTRSR